MPFLLATPGNLAPLGATTFTRADAATCATYHDVAVLVQTVAANILRDAHYISGVRTILLESSQQNIILNSQGVDGASYTRPNTTAVADQGLAPDGTLTADLIYPTTTGANRQAYQNPVTAAVPYVYSAYLKANGFSWATLGKFSGAAGGTFFNLANGVIGTVAATYTALMIPMANGNYRCVVFGTGAAGSSFFAALLADADNTTTATTNGTNGINVWGVQAVQSTVLGSYIKTLGTAVTRAVDALSLAGTALVGTLFYHYYDLATLAWTDAVAAYAGNVAIVPPVDRAYSHIAVVQGTRTAAQCKAILGGYFP